MSAVGRLKIKLSDAGGEAARGRTRRRRAKEHKKSGLPLPPSEETPRWARCGVDPASMQRRIPGSVRGRCMGSTRGPKRSGPRRRPRMAAPHRARSASRPTLAPPERLSSACEARVADPPRAPWTPRAPPHHREADNMETREAARRAQSWRYEGSARPGLAGGPGAVADVGFSTRTACPSPRQANPVWQPELHLRNALPVRPDPPGRRPGPPVADSDSMHQLSSKSASARPSVQVAAARSTSLPLIAPGGGWGVWRKGGPTRAPTQDLLERGLSASSTTTRAGSPT